MNKLKISVSIVLTPVSEKGNLLFSIVDFVPKSLKASLQSIFYQIVIVLWIFYGPFVHQKQTSYGPNPSYLSGTTYNVPVPPELAIVIWSLYGDGRELVQAVSSLTSQFVIGQGIGLVFANIVSESYTFTFVVS